MGNKNLKKRAQKSLFLKIFFIFETYFLLFIDMYGLYDRDGVLRFVNSDREACLDYAKLFEMNSAHCCLMNLISSIDRENNINLDLNLAKNNN